MAAKARRKLGYNWRARQSRAKATLSCRAREGGTGERKGELEDSNTLILPPRPKKQAGLVDETAGKRRRLSCKQRKRLQRILDVKEKKAKRSEVMADLTCLSLTPAQLTHLVPSTSLSSPVPPSPGTCSVTVGQGRGVPVWRMRRRRRKRRQLRAEKEVCLPTTAPQNSSSELESSETEGELWGTERESELQGTERESELRGTERESELRGTERESELRGTERESELQGTERERTGGGINLRAEEDENKISAQFQETTEIGGGSVAMETGVAQKRAVFVQLDRPAEVQGSRGQLPIVGEEARVMEQVREVPVTVLCGETGSGKTTQLPQFLYEHGYTLPEGPCGGGMIVVTEPRRVAAVSMAHRVAYEMGLSQRQVSFQIRHEGNVTDDTVIKFVTDGVLLKEIEQDFQLERYSVVVVDEAHERSVFTDILLGLLSRIVPLRLKAGRPLKLVVMSATLRVEDFTMNPTLFPSPPPTLSVESRQFPVTVHFSRRTLTSYLREAYRKICRIHRELPPGHVLVFLTGQVEVLQLCRLLERTFPSDPSHLLSSHQSSGDKRERKRRQQRRNIDLNEYPLQPPETQPGSEEEEGEGCEEVGTEVSAHDQQLPMKVLPLYSLLPSERQREVFQPVPEGVRLCVVATNIAETSLTIPDIKYVVDTGKVKRKYYDKVTGISAFRVEWVSQASANQRAGRAGRTQPGHCYRLYSSAVFENQFAKFSEPEIVSRPVQDLVLQLKALGIHKVANFPFPTPPSAEALEAAEKILWSIGALSSDGKLTPLGHTLSQLPVAPRYGKMLALGHQHGCLPYVISLVAALSVKELVAQINSNLTERKELAALRRVCAGKGELHMLGDAGLLLAVAGAWSCAGDCHQFCQATGLQPRAMRELARLRQQLTNSVNILSPDLNLTIDPQLAPPTPDQVWLLQQIVLSGLGDQVARKMSGGAMTAEDKRKLRLSYQCASCEGPVYLHHGSLFASSPPDWLVYQELVDSGDRVYLRGVTAVEEKWLPEMVPQLCSLSTPLESPPPTFDLTTGTVQCHVSCTYGVHQWQLATQQIPHPPDLQLYRLFAVFLLQGKVCSALAQFSASLLLPPVTMVKSWAKLHPETAVLLKALAERGVSSRESLLQQWETEPKYLLKAFSLWLPQSKHAELAAMWPPN